MEMVRRGKKGWRKEEKAALPPSLYFPSALIRLLDHKEDSGDILLFF